ncbi:unnamed protein product [Calypogeia fissa]
MVLHSIHRYASSARHKTAASLRSVFSSHGHSKVSSMVLALSKRSFMNSDINPGDVQDFPNSGGVMIINQQEGIFDAFDGDSSDDEGYVTASEDCREFEERDSDDSSNEAAEDARRTKDCMQEGVPKDYGQKWDLQSRSNGSHTGMEISELRPVSELRDTVIDLESEERLKEVDDATLLRFLKARNMDVAKASEMFIKDWRWRGQFAPKGFIAEDEISRQLLAEKAFLQGLDRKGRPLMILIGAKHFSKGRDMDEFKRYCFYCIERVIASMPAGVEQFVTIFDSGSTGYRNMDTSASLMMVDFLQAHYPERMSKLFLVHWSSLFQGAYRLVEPAVDIDTRKKIVFVVDKEMESILTEEIGGECLPKAYGGMADFIPIQYAQINSEAFPCRAVSCQ